MSLLDKMKAAVAESAEKRRQERDFVRRHKLKKDESVTNRWWLDDRRYIDADLRDPIEREQAELEIAVAKKKVRVKTANEGRIAPRTAKKGKANDFELRPFDFNAPMPWDEKKKATPKPSGRKERFV